MKKVAIKYNPYKLETSLTVDGKSLAQNSKVGERIAPGARLQEWVEDLPQILVEEYNDNEFDIEFTGTLLDYEDLTEAFAQAHQQGKVACVKLERIPAKETADKEVLIDKVFEKIQAGPFEDLKGAEIVNAFQNAKSRDFEVCVVAPMSAGKSTLINALLGVDLMPSLQEACTAKIVRIRDTDAQKTWRAEVYDQENHLLETHENVTIEEMNSLNENPKVSTIQISGDIPFVSAEDTSLVLIDTPGPNNKRDPQHREVQESFLKKSSKALVLYVLEGTFGNNDDDNLLAEVAASMAVGGKQSKDRFLFVRNKMDGRKNDKNGQDITEQSLKTVRDYLSQFRIASPNLFPAAALPALDIRLIQSGAEVDVDTLDEAETLVKKLNRNDDLYLERYAPLPASIRAQIDARLDEAKERQDAYTEALIHTGVVSIEAAIRQYVQKYAKTAKIKNIVDTFTHKLEEVNCYEKTKQELAKNCENRDQIVKQIQEIRQKADDIKTAKQFKQAVRDAAGQVQTEADEIIHKIVQKYQAKIRHSIDELRGRELSPDQAKEEVRRLEKEAKKLEPAFQNELDDLIREALVKTSNALLQEYKKKLASLASQITFSGSAGIAIDPLQLMGGSIPSAENFSTDEFVHSKKVENGKEWVPNTNKKWYKPWTWFEEDGFYRTKYKTVKYISASDLAQEFFAPVKEGVLNNGTYAKTYVTTQSGRIVASFDSEFQRLDENLKQKLSELESYAGDQKLAEERVQETEKRLQWLDAIRQELDSILEI